MKKAFSLICTLSFALVATADETSIVNYGTQTTSPTLPLIWHYRVETDGIITYAIIDGVRVDGGANPTGALAVPTSVVDEGTGDAYVVKEIADGTFANQIGLTSISVPVTVERIGTGVFNGCTVLAEISVDEDNPWYTSAKGVLYDKDLTKLVACPARTEVVTLPATLTEIGAEAFANCHRLASLEIPASVEAIGERAFLGCTRLSSVSFAGDAPTAPADIIQDANPSLVFTKKAGSTGWNAAPWNGFTVQTAEAGQPSGIVSASFGNVIWRYRVINGEAEIYGGGSAAIPTSTVQTYSYDPDTFMWIPDGKLVIPSSLGGYPVTRIGDYAFSGCSALTEVVIPQTIRHIGDYAFANCTGITELTFPSGVQSIGYHPFSGAAITSLALPDSLRTLDGNPLAGCDTVLSVSLSADNSYYAVVNGVLYDKDVSTLIGCPARKESVSIATTATRIGPEAFDGCFRLRAVLLPDALESVGTNAFRGAVRLSSVVFPASVARLEGAGLFEGCASLEFVGFAGNAPAVDPALFAGTQGTLSIYVAQETTGWKDATPALPDSGTWPTADANGRAIANLDVPPDPELKEGDIFVGITTNGTIHYAYTLKVLANKGVEILGISPKPIGSFNVPSDFESSLGKLTVKSLGPRLFENAIGLLSVEVPNAVTNIGNEVFRNCSSLATVTLSHGLRVIGRHPFAGTAIETIALPDTVSSIDGNPIYGCDPSVSISVGANNPYFSVSSEGALYDKDFTTLFAVPMTAEELTVPASVAAISDEAFAGCIRLKKLTFEGNAPTAADDVFADTPTTMTNYVGSSATGFTTDTWKSRPIVVGAGNTDSNTDGTWIWVVENDVAKLYNNGESAFVDTNYSGAVSIPAEVTDSGSGKKYTVAAIGDHALCGCKYVTSASIPSTIQSIGAEPFGGTRIATLAIPAYVESIDGNPAAGCTRFTGFTVDAENINFATDNAGCLYDYQKTALLAVPARATEVTIPATVTTIADDAFAGCTILAKATFDGNAPTAADGIFADTPEQLKITVSAGSTGWDGNPESDTPPTSGLWRDRQIFADDSRSINQEYDDGTVKWTYDIAKGKAVITGASGEAEVVTVPATLGGYAVSTINADALDGLSGVKAYKSESDLYKTKNGCLYSADGKTLIRVPDSLVLPYSVTTEVSSKIVTVTIVPGLKDSGNPGNDGTSVTTNITSISTSRTKEKIDGDISFDALLSGVTTIADHAFYGCNSNLTNDYTSTSENLSGETGFIGTSGDAYVRTSTKVTSTNSTYETTFTLPATVKTVGANAFEGSGVVSSRNTTPQTPTDNSSRRQELTDTRQLAESSRYIGWIEQSGKIVGTVAVKTGKARNGVIKTSGSVVKIGAKKTKIKSMSELSAIDGLTLVKDLSASKSDATAFNAFKGKCWTVALMTSNSNAALLDGYTTLSIAIQAKGKVRIAGTAADGTKISASAQMVVDGDTFKIPVAAQLYSGKRGGFATVFTVTEEGEISVDGTSVAFTAILNGAPVHISLLTIDSALRGNALSGDISIWGAGNDEYSLAENLGWKPRYTKSSGQFKGKLYLIRNSDMKRVRATVTGVVANEIGYGTAVVKGVRSLKVEVK